MLNSLMIGVSYAVLFSLLLSLNFFTKFSIKIKIFFTVLSLLFFITTYISVREMQGRPYKDNNLVSDARPYKILWHGVNEPNKIKGTKGKIFILLQSIDEMGVVNNEPRLVEVPFGSSLYEKMEEIKKITRNGVPISVRFTNLNIKNSNSDILEYSLDGIDKFNSLSGEIDINFEEIRKNSLPKK
ncbi:hypothetical protein OAD15_04620 [Hyphomicrobiales bacterium]|nr:hypothetical protein [Hyphomicrobiales bacterium]